MYILPTYKFQDKNTGKVWKEFMGISECDKYLAENPHIERLVNGAPRIVSGVGTAKVPDGFRDVMKAIKKRSGKDNKINIY